MENITSVKYMVKVYTSRWACPASWEWRDELIAEEELTELDAMDTIHILKTGDGVWSQWADVMGDATAEYEATDWDDAKWDDQWTIVIYRFTEDEDGDLYCEEQYAKSIWASEWASM